MKYIITLFFLLSISTAFSQVTREKFSAHEIRKELGFLYQTLQETHYNLYVKTSRSQFDQEFKRLSATIRDSMTILQCHRLFQPFTALSGLAHCNINYPFSPSYVNYVMNKGTVFPFDISIEGNRLFISANYSGDHRIKINDEVLSINGITAAGYVKKIYNYLSGENMYIKSTQVDLMYFPRINWFVYDRADVYTLKIKHSEGNTAVFSVKAIAAAEYEGAAGQKKPKTNTAREFKWLGDIAYLHPGVFLNVKGGTDLSDHNTLEKGEFVHFIDSCFKTVRNAHTQHLIIDLRGNPGGDNSFSDEMVAYIANKPFSFCSKFYVKTSAITKQFWENVTDTQVATLRKIILENENGKILNWTVTKHPPKHDSLRFRGKVYVLTDRYSYSNAVSVAAVIQDYKFGVILGEPTADAPTTFAAIHQFTLPVTRMTVSYPKAFIIRPNGNRKLQGLMPDIPIKTSSFNETDEMLNKATMIINQMK